MLKVENLEYQFKGKPKQKEQFRLRDISFRLEKGYIMGLLGLNGAGKSTLMKLLMGIYTPDSGSITFHGEEVSANTDKVLQKIACISDEAEFLRYRTLEENAELFGILYDNFEKEKWEGHMEYFGFGKDSRGLCYGALSAGEKRKFQLAFTLSYQPELLLLDEPTANLDPHARVEWIEFLQKLVAEEEISVIIATHITGDLDRIADYILMLDKGDMLAYMDREGMVGQYGEI